MIYKSLTIESNQLSLFSIVFPLLSLRLWLFTLLAFVTFHPLKAHAMTSDQQCQASIIKTVTAKAHSMTPRPWQQPQMKWQDTSLPDNWNRRWPGYSGGAWYKIQWRMVCDNENTSRIKVNHTKQARQPEQSHLMALYIDYISMAGAVYINDVLLWRDTNLIEPLSRSWNSPRYWLLPIALLNGTHTNEPPSSRQGIEHFRSQEINTLWVYVVGASRDAPGLGRVHIGKLSDLQAHYEQQTWRKRTLFMINLVASALLGIIFLIIWLIYRKESVYGWLAGTQIFGCLFFSNIVTTHTAPFSDSIQLANANLSFFVLFVSFFFAFVWKFAGVQYTKFHVTISALTVISLVITWLSPQTFHVFVALSIFLIYVAIFLINCLVFQFFAWRKRSLEIRLMATCLALFFIISIHDVIMLFNLLGDDGHRLILAPYASLAIIISIALIMALRLRLSWMRTQLFNEELQSALEKNRQELTFTMDRQHKLALENAQLQARLQLSHDLHDGLGGSLVRSITTIENNTEQLTNQQFISVLKLLRNDLRQVIDSGSSLGANAPDTPLYWAAPVRHRFSQLFEELDIDCRWHIPTKWHHQPSTLKCLTLLRVLEESLTNIMKHSKAHHVTVRLTFPQADTLLLEIIDDGVGFNVEAVRQSGLSVGMRSMQVRLARYGGQLDITSAPGETYVRAEMMID